MARKTLKFRLYPNRQQREKLQATLDLCRELYNAGLQERSSGLLSRAVHDVGWSSFINKLSYKAENAGRQLLKVDPNYTSQECPNCHAIQKKQLSERWHRCDCGLTIHRDHAAALVILGRGLRLQAETKPEVRVSVA